MDHVQFGMSPNPDSHANVVEQQSPAVGDMAFAIPSVPSVVNRHQSHDLNSSNLTLFPPMTPLVHAPHTPGGRDHRDHGPFSNSLYSQSIPSISAVVPSTPGGSDSIPIPQLQNIVSTVNLGKNRSFWYYF